jgi:hypothetical protein
MKGRPHGPYRQRPAVGRGERPLKWGAVRPLPEQVSVLMHDELKLAQMEMTRKGKQAGAGIGLLGSGGMVAFYGDGCSWPLPGRAQGASAQSGFVGLPADNRLFGGTGRRAVAGGLRSK